MASQGNTVEEARANLREAVELHVETIIRKGELDVLLERIGRTEKDLKKDVLMSELFSGSLQIPLAV